MEACGLEVLRPVVLSHHPSELGAAACGHLATLSTGGLEGALRVLDAALPVAASPLLKLGVLLSAAAAGTGSTLLEAERPGPEQEQDDEPQAVVRHRAATSRNQVGAVIVHASDEVSCAGQGFVGSCNLKPSLGGGVDWQLTTLQVNLMLTAASTEPHIQRFLWAAAAMLCDHSVTASSADPRSLLPALHAKHVDPAMGVAVPLAVGGQLAEAAPGVLLLSSSALDPKRAAGLGQCIAACEAALHPGCPELCVPVGATFWTMVHEQGAQQGLEAVLVMQLEQAR